MPARHHPFTTHVLLIALAPFTAASQPSIPGPAADRPLPFRLERLWSVGGANDDALLLTRIFSKDLAADARGRLFVVDRTESRVAVYDSAGRLARTLGTKGPGPGELLAPLWVDVRADERVIIGAAEKGTVVVFAPDGAAEPEFRLTPRLRSVRAMPGGAYLGSRYPTPDSLALVATSAGAPTTLLQVAVPRTRSTPPVCRLTDYPAGPIFAPTLTWAVRGDRVVASTGRFEVHVYRGTVRQRTLTRATPLRPSSPSLARQHLGPGETIQIVGMPPCTVPASLILSVAEVAPTLPAYDALAIAPDERIWATRLTVRGEPGLADVYHPERGYEGTVSLGGARPALFLSTGALISIEQDADGVPTIVAYRVVRTALTAPR